MHQTPQQNCLIARDDHTAPSTPSSLVLQDHQHNKCVRGDLKAQFVNRKILSLARPNVPPVPGRVLTCPNNSKYLSRKGGNTFLEGQYIIQLFGIDSETEIINFRLYPKSTTTVSTTGIHIQRVTDFSQEGGRQQMDSSKSKGSGCSSGNLPLQNPPKRASLVAQWLRICLPMQGTGVQALIREDPTCRGATKSMCHNC